MSVDCWYHIVKWLDFQLFFFFFFSSFFFGGAYTCTSILHSAWDHCLPVYPPCQFPMFLLLCCHSLFLCPCAHCGLRKALLDWTEWKSRSMCICHDECGCWWMEIKEYVYLPWWMWMLVNGNQGVCVFAMMNVDVGEWKSKSMCICHDGCGRWCMEIKEYV